MVNVESERLVRCIKIGIRNTTAVKKDNEGYWDSLSHHLVSRRRTSTSTNLIRDDLNELSREF